MRMLSDTHLKGYGLTTMQVLTLIAVERLFDESPSITDLSETMSTSRQNVKQLVNQLVKKGFLALNRDVSDNRVLRISTTEKNRMYWEKYNTQHTEYLIALFTRLSSDEISTLDILISKLYQSL
ncbi:MAG: MarR family transcriptional regulator [Candidatus Heimdallarchaeota archaeon]|nr:MarR family transcriptional regulator [Candidatus Heimdallarchaeota archaeon]